MADLSPHAQAVLDAATDRWLGVDDDIPAQVAAAALRAAAIEIVLSKYQFADWEMAHMIMQEMQALVDELEGVDD